MKEHPKTRKYANKLYCIDFVIHKSKWCSKACTHEPHFQGSIGLGFGMGEHASIQLQWHSIPCNKLLAFAFVYSKRDIYHILWRQILLWNVTEVCTSFSSSFLYFTSSRLRHIVFGKKRSLVILMQLLNPALCP